MKLAAQVDGTFRVESVNDNEPAPRGFVSRVLSIMNASTKDQRQQFGRFCHSVAVPSLAGAVGYYHATAQWDIRAILNETQLIGAFVLAFYQGLASMNGE